jgi:phosphoribosylaminoimidazolecarboxamide formyltransferase / IMP cyclohydrolase
MTDSHPRRALVSVSNKEGLVPFIKTLTELGFEILSTGGTRRHLEEAGLPVIDVTSYTGFPEMMEGRVKTLHPKVHGAILGRPHLPDDAAAMKEHGIVPFEMVICNLYPFQETIAREGVSVEEAIEQIDIGGPSMIRSAAKNHAHVAVVTSSAQYPMVLEALKTDQLTAAFRRELALAAFEMTADYDQAIADYFENLQEEPSLEEQEHPRLKLTFQRKMKLRYGENPHQEAAWYFEPGFPTSSLSAARQLTGKELSYNNILDLDAALNIVREFTDPAAVVIKHNNPCGCGIGETLGEAFERAYAGDPVSAFGSIIGFNRPVDAQAAEKLSEPDRFVEAIIAPRYEEDAYEILTTRPKWKKNVRLMQCPLMMEPRAESWDYRRVSGGLLVQTPDEAPAAESEWKAVTHRKPADAELRDLKFAWTVCKHVKSNAIVFAREGQIVGVGAGQMSRLDSAFIAAHKAGEKSRGGVVASDAFFPFRDGVDEAARAGITAVIQPGGSRNDEEVIAAAGEHNMAMIFTGRRHFRH